VQSSPTNGLHVAPLGDNQSDSLDPRQDIFLKSLTIKDELQIAENTDRQNKSNINKDKETLSLMFLVANGIILFIKS
jgi:hypothetical protein